MGRCARLGENGQDFSRPAQRLTYDEPSKRLLLDSARPELKPDDSVAWDAQSYAEIADRNFRRLASKGVGAWDGCYGDGHPTMKSRVHLPESVNGREWGAGWQGSTDEGVVYKDWAVTQDAVIHEWTHALVGRTVNMDSDGGLNNQTGGLYESLADTFAVLFRNDGTFTISSTLGVRRDMADPAATSQAAHIVDFDKPHDLARDEYFKAGIPSKAVHLMLVGDRYPKETLEMDGVRYVPQDVGRIEIEKVELIYFQVLGLDEKGEKYLSSTPSFSEFANAVFDACTDLETRKIGGITTDDCTNAKKAFMAVGMLGSTPPPDSTCAEAAIPGKPLTGRIALVSGTPRNILSILDLANCQISEVGVLPTGVAPINIAWSPDGTMIAYVSGTQERTQSIMVLDLLTNQSRVIASRGEQNLKNSSDGPAWSPDGKQIAFASWQGTNRQIFVANLETGQVKQLTSSTGNKQAPDWSSDGAQLAFWTNGEIGIVDSGGGDVTVLTNDNLRFHSPKWAPGGARIALFSADGELWTIATEQRELTNLTNSPARDSQLSWSPNGDYIAFTSDRDSEGDVYRATAVYIAAADGSRPIRVTALGVDYPCWLRQ